MLGIGLRFEVLSGSALRTGSSSAKATYTTTRVDEATGLVTYSKDNGGSNIADGDIIYFVSDWQASSAFPAGQTNVMLGLKNYAPATASSNLYGLNQRVNPARLTGLRLSKASFTTGNTTKKDIILRALARQRRTQAMCKYLACNAEEFVDIVQELDSSVRYNRFNVKSGTATIGFDALAFTGPGGATRLVEENVIENDTVWGLNPGDFEICSLRRFINPWNFDGKIIDRVLGQDRIYGAINSRAQLKASKPKNLLHVTTTK